MSNTSGSSNVSSRWKVGSYQLALQPGGGISWIMNALTTVLIQDLSASISDAGAGTREPGGAVGATCPHNFETVGAPPPQPKTVSVVHFLFVFFSRELGCLPKQ